MSGMLLADDTYGHPDHRWLVKANLPATQQGYLSGNGEGVWVALDDYGRRDWEDDIDEAERAVLGETTLTQAVLHNDSVYWPGLRHGSVIPVEMRGEFRPVVPFEWLSSRFALNENLDSIKAVLYVLSLRDGTFPPAEG